MIQKSPAYQHYPDKWLADTRRLSWAAKGIYKDLLDVIWMQFQDTCSVPSDDAFIAAELGASMEEWKSAKAEILNPHRPLMTVLETNRLFSNGLWKERCKQLERREQLARNGSKGGRPKKQKVISEKPNDNQNESLSSPSPSSSPIPSPEKEEDMGGTSRTKYPPGITLNRETWTWTGITDADREAWGVAYPAVDLTAEIAAAAQWCRTNGAKGVKSKYDRFLVNWLKRAQDRAGGGGTRSMKFGRKEVDPTEGAT